MFLDIIFVGIMVLAILFSWKKMLRHHKSKEVIIFSRYPTPGTTKTRLIPDLGKECASYAQLVMTNHILDNIDLYCDKNSDTCTIVYYNGGTNQQMKYWLGKRKHQVSWELQSKGGLGEKLANAFKDSFKRGSKFTVVVGSDIPGINPKILSEAYHKLEIGSEMVLGPAADGGYYLVGISESLHDKLNEVFSNINWGTETVFKEQSERAESLGISLGILDTVLSDVDLPEDLQVFEREIKLSKSQLMKPKLSIIVPVYNEGNTIMSTLQTVLKKCLNQTLIAEIIVSDGGSTDNTVNVVNTFSDSTTVPVKVVHSAPDSTTVPVKVVHSAPGRGFQQRFGAEHATGDYLMFLHADTIVPKHFDEAITNCLRVPGNVAGAFKFSLDVIEIPERKKEVSTVFMMKMKFLTMMTQRRFRNYELPFGDQILFMSRKIYDTVGGFKEVYLMEDYMMVEELRKIGHIGIADAGPAITSSRRWEKWGYVRVSGLNSLIILAYKLGVTPNRLAKWYYGDKLKEITKRSKHS